jgi:hypothetical protein
MTDLSRLPSTLVPAPGGRSLEEWADELASMLQRELDALKEHTGGSLRWQNLRSNLVTNQTSNASPTVTTVTHNLGKIPEVFIVNPYASVNVWATSTNRSNWSNTTIELLFSASVTFDVLVL